MTETNRLLVMRGGALGDFVLGLPALHALRRAFPRATLELVAPAAVLPLASWLADILTPLEQAEVASLFGGPEALPDEVLRRYGGLDLVVLWLADREGAVRANFRRLGARRILWAPALPGKTGRHATDHLLDTLRPLGIRRTDDAAAPACQGVGTTARSPLQDDEGSVLVRPGEPAREAARALWDRLGLSAGNPVVAVHPGSGGLWKTWRPERFAAVIDRLRVPERGATSAGPNGPHPDPLPGGEEDHVGGRAPASGVQVVLIQGPADEESVQRVLASLRGQHPPVVDRLAVEELAAFLSLCTAYLGNDSGVTHLAAAVGVPTVALFGPTDPATWGPRSRQVVVLDSGSRARKPALRPVCGQAGSGVSPGPSALTTSLDAIQVEQVLEAVRRLAYENQ